MKFSMRLCQQLLSSATTQKFGVASVSKQIDHFSGFYPSSLTIQQLVDFGRKGDQKSSYMFLRKELLVRLANIMQEINILPTQLLEMPSAKIVRDWYHDSFTELLEYADTAPTVERLSSFTHDLSSILKRHSNVVETMAEAMLEMREAYGINPATNDSMQYFLDRFYMNRISIRMLINQHVLLFGGKLPETPRHVGSIDPACNVMEIIDDAYLNAKFLCDRYYMTSPNVKIECKNGPAPGDKAGKVTVVCVPSHLYHIVFEMLKNAMRAVVEFNGPEQALPEIRILVVKGKEDLSIKISDRGGGVPRGVGEMLFRYMYSTAPRPSRDGSIVPMAGYGYGLPLSRLYARYFQGDLILDSMEGYGTDAVVYLKALSTEASEMLPVYSSSSRRRLMSSAQGCDWSQPRMYSTYSRGFTSSMRVTD